MGETTGRQSGDMGGRKPEEKRTTLLMTGNDKGYVGLSLQQHATSCWKKEAEARATQRRRRREALDRQDAAAAEALCLACGFDNENDTTKMLPQVTHAAVQPVMCFT